MSFKIFDCVFDWLVLFNLQIVATCDSTQLVIAFGLDLFSCLFFLLDILSGTCKK